MWYAVQSGCTCSNRTRCHPIEQTKCAIIQYSALQEGKSIGSEQCTSSTALAAARQLWQNTTVDVLHDVDKLVFTMA